MWAKAALVIVLLGGLSWHLWQDEKREKDLDAARDQIAQQKQSISNLARVNQANIDTINELATANGEWQQRWAEANGNFSETVQRLQSELTGERTARARARREAAAELNRILNDESWSDKPIPEPVADWLCQHVAVSCGSTD